MKAQIELRASALTKLQSLKEDILIYQQIIHDLITYPVSRDLDRKLLQGKYGFDWPRFPIERIVDLKWSNAFHNSTLIKGIIFDSDKEADAWKAPCDGLTMIVQLWRDDMQLLESRFNIVHDVVMKFSILHRTSGFTKDFTPR